MIRRGAVLVGVHFSGRPQTNDASERLVVEIGNVLERTGGLGRIYLVPFGDLQREISLNTPPDLRVLLYRRLMIRVAEQVAAAENAKALVTGESLGQVASQTLDNIRVVDEVATLPVLRPLVGSDKTEIIGDARRIGTYEPSTQDHVDCCTLFMPRTPETHARLQPVLDAEAVLDVPRMVADALSGYDVAGLRVAVLPSAQALAHAGRGRLNAVGDRRLSILALEPYYGGSHRAVLDALVGAGRRRLGAAHASRAQVEVAHARLGDHVRRPKPSRSPSPLGTRARTAAVRSGLRLDVREPRRVARAGGPRARGGARRRLLPREPARLSQSPHRRVGLPVPAHEHHLGAVCRVLPLQHAVEPRWLPRRDPRLPAAVPGPPAQGGGRANRARSPEVVHPPFEPAAFDAHPPRRGERCRIVWPHRWEHDKNPEAFFRAVATARGRRASTSRWPSPARPSGTSRTPSFAPRSCSATVSSISASRGSRDEYAALLASSDVAVSTALNEFFGIAMIEACYAGCFPLVPERLAYPELYPPEMRYDSDDELVARLRSARSFASETRARRANSQRHTPSMHSRAQYASRSRPSPAGTDAKSSPEVAVESASGLSDGRE